MLQYESSKTIDYDIKILSLKDKPLCITFECKYDLYAEKSGNIAIEVWNTKKDTPSGLMATKADFWVHILGESAIWICKTLDLRVIVDTEPPFKIVEGGDDNSKMLLYKKKSILKPPFVLLTKENLYEVVFKS